MSGISDMSTAKRAVLRARHQKNTDLAPRAYCTNNDDVHGDHREFENWPCAVIQLLDRVEALESLWDAPRERPVLQPSWRESLPSLFDTIRAAQDLLVKYQEMWPGEDYGEYARGLAEMTCSVYHLHERWIPEVGAEIRQEHGKYVRT